MSTSCLLTKLKGVVNNPNLPIYNGIVIDVHEVANPTADTQWLHVNGTGVTVEVPEEYPMTDSAHLANGTYKVIIRNKYAMSNQFGLGPCGTLNIDQLVGCIGLTKISGNAIKIGDIKNLASLTLLEWFQAENSTELSGDISVFANMPNLSYVNLRQSSVYGDISVFSDKTSLTTLTIARCSGLTGNLEDLGELININIPEIAGTNIHGSFDEYVSRQVAAGRTSYAPTTATNASVMMNCTFGGKVRLQSVIWTWPSWEGADKVIVYVGAANYQDCPTIYEKGATAEEIAAWQAAGKTVTDVLTDTVYLPTNG